MTTLPSWILLTLLVPMQAHDPDASLARLATVESEESRDRVLATLEPLLKRARAINRADKVEARLFATRCLGVAAALDVAQPADLSGVIAALEDEAQVVRRVARRAILRASLPAKALIRKARKSLLRDLRASSADAAVCAEIEAMREQLLAQLRPAAPGRSATPGRVERRAPRLNARRNANESAAIATLKNLASAQAQAQASGTIDVDGDGRGEFGYLHELSGGPIRGDETGAKLSAITMNPPVLSGAFKRVQSGVVQRSGYLFRVFLPGEDARPLAESDDGGAKGRAVSAREASRFWCAYAWPVAHGTTGQRAFFVDQQGDIYACRNVHRDYEGYERSPLPDAVRRLAGEKPATLADPAARGQRARDGNVWSIVN